MHISLDHGDSISSLIEDGSSCGAGGVGFAVENTGMLKTRAGEAGGLLGGDAMEDAYDREIWSTMLEHESKGFNDSADNMGKGGFSVSDTVGADMI